MCPGCVIHVEIMLPVGGFSEGCEDGADDDPCAIRQ